MRMFHLAPGLAFVAALAVVGCQGAEPHPGADSFGAEASALAAPAAALTTPAGDFESGVYVPIDELQLASWNVRPPLPTET